MNDAVLIISRNEIRNVKDGYVRDVSGSSWSISEVKSASFSPDGQEIVLVVSL